MINKIMIDRDINEIILKDIIGNNMLKFKKLKKLHNVRCINVLFITTSYNYGEKDERITFYDLKPSIGYEDRILELNYGRKTCNCIVSTSFVHPLNCDFMGTCGFSYQELIHGSDRYWAESWYAEGAFNVSIEVYCIHRGPR